jgi:serine O-acetyltransferase
VIFHHVSIGSNTLYDSGGIGAPTIGDNCYLGAGAKIVGNIKIGSNSRIGAGTFVYQDVSENSIITSGSPRIIKMRKHLNNRFYHKHKGGWAYFDDGSWIKVREPKEIEHLDRHFH